MDWSPYYPAFVVPQNLEQISSSSTAISDARTGNNKQLVQDVEVADIGCGFGGLLVALAPKLPDKLLLGMTIDLCSSFIV